ncbi:MAG: ribonuclease HII [Gemmobacter sp.]
MRPVPDFHREADAIARGIAPVVGVDEAGRGPLAGPVVAAAVWLDPARIPPGLDDSKALTALARDRLFDRLQDMAEVAVGLATVAEIDAMNILRASHLAMARAVANLRTPGLVLVDGNLIPPGLPCRAEAVIGGDARVVTIAAASIIAKVTRDRIMVDLAQQFPVYGWDRNMGYPTATHRKALLDFGVTPHHRRSYAPVHKALYQDKSVTP